MCIYVNCLGLNLLDLPDSSFIYAYMDAPTQLELCLNDQLDIARLQLVPYFLLQFLLPF